MTTQPSLRYKTFPSSIARKTQHGLRVSRQLWTWGLGRLGATSTRPARNNKTNLHDIGSTATCAWFRHRELTGSCRRPASCDVVMCIVRVMIAICGPYYVASQRTVLEVNCNSLVCNIAFAEMQAERWTMSFIYVLGGRQTNGPPVSKR